MKISIVVESEVRRDPTFDTERVAVLSERK